MAYLTFLLQKDHVRDQFECGNEALTRYLRTQAGQDSRKRLAVCFVLADTNKSVQGFYTLSNDALSTDALPEPLRKKLRAPYDKIPVTLLGRLAVDKSIKGRGFGGKLLIDALRRSYEASWSIGSLAVVVDPIDDTARSFYLKYGFIHLPDSTKMFLPMQTVAGIFEDAAPPIE